MLAASLPRTYLCNSKLHYTQDIYNSIRKNEIVMPEEHTGQLDFEHAWKELLTRSRQAGELMTANTAFFDMEIFKSVWKPVISAIAYAFISFDDDYFIERAVVSFRQCATLAGSFLMPYVFDFVVVSLSQATGLLSEAFPAQVPAYPVVDVKGQNVTVSNLSVTFGTNFKGQPAAVVLFKIVNGNGNALREGWTQIFEMFQTLFLRSLLPTRMLQMEDFLGVVSMIPLRGAQSQRHPARNKGGGLLSAPSSYLMTPYAANSEVMPEATDADVENTLCTIDCISSCRLDELYSQIMYLDLPALVAAVRALVALAHERTVARLRQEAEEGGARNEEVFTLPYDPVSVFLLETMVSVATQTPQHIDEICLNFATQRTISPSDNGSSTSSGGLSNRSTLQSSSSSTSQDIIIGITTALDSVSVPTLLGVLFGAARRRHTVASAIPHRLMTLASVLRTAITTRTPSADGVAGASSAQRILCMASRAARWAKTGTSLTGSVHRCHHVAPANISLRGE